jgi:hypothetical protein
MTREELPGNLAAIERRLRGAGEPSGALRCRVTARVREELRGAKRLAFWQYAAALAASVMLLLNFGFSTAAVPTQILDMDRSRLTLLREEIRHLNLPLSPGDVRRQCVLLAAADALVPMGTPRGSAGRGLPDPPR